MTISGFSMVRNGVLLYYPIAQSIQSILPLVDEFVVAVGKGDAEDTTLEAIQSIGSDKIRIIETEWDLEKFPNGTENAHQTDIAKNACNGDWLFYLQADEVIHENSLHTIRNRCEELLSVSEVEGLLFDYYHFWGDYDHYHLSHAWYPHEIRIVRNDPEIHSWESAQSFRRIPQFDGRSYRQQEGTYKLKVAKVNASVYHYGFVRPPDFMQRKRKALDTIHKGAKASAKEYDELGYLFDYGALGRLAEFKESHPAVMREKIEELDWREHLNYSDNADLARRKPYGHERLKNRLMSFVEQRLNKGRPLFTFKNYDLLDV